MTRHTLFFIFSCFLALFMEACGEKVAIEQAVEPRPLTLTRSQEDFIDNSNAFSISLLQEIDRQTQDNYVFSPLSIYMTLTMLQNGSDASCFSELSDALGNGNDLSLINDYSKQLLERAPTWDPSVRLSFANALIINSRYTNNVQLSFSSTLKDYFHADVALYDFFRQQEVLRHINNWCLEKTNGMIPDALSDVTPDAFLYLINADYFKGTWMSPFKKKNSKKTIFKKDDGKEADVWMMSAERSLFFLEGEGFAAVELPYGNGTFVFKILLPDSNHKLHDLIQYLRQNGWSRTMAGANERLVQLYVPKFETASERIELKSVLPKIGISQIFSNGLDQIANNRALSVSEMIHKTHFCMDEYGSEAAAATIAVMATDGLMEPEEPLVFLANRPFIYAIEEKTTGLLLFMGKYGGD